jgi:hypothetical protein
MNDAGTFFLEQGNGPVGKPGGELVAELRQYMGWLV